MRTVDHPSLLVALIGLLIAGCSFSPRPDFDASDVPNATPQPVERSEYGNPDSYVVFGQRYYVLPSSKGYIERGIASWYGPGFDGQRTSSGEIYDMYAMTAAHKTLPLPTYARVTNLENARSVIVKINDRGPFHDNRVIDLSYAAAAKLGMLKAGTALVEVKAITVGQPPTPAEVVESEPEPQSLPSRPRIYVQVGAFANKLNAERLEARLTLSAIGHVFIEPTLSAGARLYRVRIGPLADVSAVDRLTEQLGQLGIKNTRVIIP